MIKVQYLGNVEQLPSDACNVHIKDIVKLVQFLNIKEVNKQTKQPNLPVTEL